MSSSSASGTGGRVTPDERIAALFGLRGEQWTRHANPVSVWTRFAVLPLLAVAVWSRVWIGWWSALAALLVVVLTVVDPLLFPPPRSTRNWASRGVFGERVWSERNAVTLPEQFRSSSVPAIAAVWQVAGLAVMGYGLVRLDLVVTVAGLALTLCAKSWYIDRAVLLFEDVKTSDPEYAAWEYGERRTPAGDDPPGDDVRERPA